MGRFAPLRNRVDPFGNVQAIPARGLFTGNRGVIHDPATKTLLPRRWTTRAWIVCTLEHPRGTRREPMGRNSPSGGAGWTELFFLDEVTALAAGHRPCFYCRREAARSFQNCFVGGNRLARATAPQIDGLLHGERHAVTGEMPPLQQDQIRHLPDGAVIAADMETLALRSGQALPWSFSGYGNPQALPAYASLVTPHSTVAALRAGYAPAWHASASL